MSLFRVLAVLPLAGCQDTPKPTPQPVLVEAKDSTGTVAMLVPGRPCRATIDGLEVLVGGRPLVAQIGTDRWTGEDAENGTTLRKNDQIVARIHAKQLFDESGIPLIRVLDNGDIVDKSNAVVRKASVANGVVTIGAITVTTDNVVLAAMLTAREALPEVRALAACGLLL